MPAGDATLASSSADAATLRDAPRDDAPLTSLDPRASMSSLAVGEIIGEGGMGVVRTAVQRSLERPVAIKTSHPGATEEDSARMLREAWVTGWLEHPGIVPVYDIVRGADGAPVVVMRRIHGATWEALARDVSWAERQGARDLLEQNLRVLVRVCEIVEFAHAKGVLHRDIKPANVMLGAFGEVYLLDWGLAVALGEEAAAHLPRAATVRELTGTLMYAPPEMTGLAGTALDARTDVYLLGAVLFEMATGRAPHDKGTATLTLESIAASPPAVPATVPRRLAAICTRAMQKSRDARHASVAELRHDILDFLRSRDSEELAHAAHVALDRLAAACAHDEPRRRIYDLYGECRFAFRESLRTWPENEAARAGLARASTIVIEHELTRDPRVAAALLDEAIASMPVPVDSVAVAPGELAARVRAAVAKETRERERISRLASDHDQSVGIGARKALFLLLGVGWSISQLVADHIGPLTHLRFAVASLVQLPVLLVASLFARDLARTLFNRRMLAAVVTTLVGQSALFFVGEALGLPLAPLRVLQIGLWTLMSAALTVLVERRFWPMTVGLGLALGATVAVPTARPYVAAAATMGITANVAVVWSRRRARAED